MIFILVVYLLIGVFFVGYSMFTQIPPMIKMGDGFPIKRFIWVAPALLLGWAFIGAKLLFDEIK